MLEWHNCKTDPPKKNGPYAVLIKTDSGLIDWYKAYWFNWGFAWSDFDKPRQNYNEIEIIKWAEVELPE